LERTLPDGLFVVDSPQIAVALASSRSMRHRPPAVVSLGAFHPGTGDFVGVDLSRPAEKAVAHLLETGRERVAFLSDEATFSGGFEARRDAYRHVLQEAGRAPEFLLAPFQHRDSAYDFTRAYVALHGCPDGLFCVNDEMAIGTHRALRDLGRRVPQDVALIGCDGIIEAEYSNPPLTTLLQPIAEMCRLGWEILERRIADPARLPEQIVLEAGLSLRESSHCLLKGT
jgi:LacI family transcriptional regulator